MSFALLENRNRDGTERKRVARQMIRRDKAKARERKEQGDEQRGVFKKDVHRFNKGIGSEEAVDG